MGQLFASGSGTATLTFTHTVVEPNYSTQGIAVLANSLALNGGTIRSSSTQDERGAVAHSAEPQRQPQGGLAAVAGWRSGLLIARACV